MLSYFLTLLSTYVKFPRMEYKTPQPTKKNKSIELSIEAMLSKAIYLRIDTL